jgi:di/tricarboxylate transporter
MSDNFIEDAKTEISGMAKQGMHHPSTKPVLTGAAVGAAAGFLLPVLSIPVGLAIGAAAVFYKRVRP